jgi:hypothetical protein
MPMRKCGANTTEITPYPIKQPTELLADLPISQPPERAPLPVTLARRTALK